MSYTEYNRRRVRKARIATVVGVLLICLIVVGIERGVYAWNRWTCAERADAMGVEWRYGYGTDCMVRAHKLDNWVDIDDLIVQNGELRNG